MVRLSSLWFRSFKEEDMFRFSSPWFLCVLLSQWQLFLLVEATAEVSSTSSCYGSDLSNSLHLSCQEETIIVVKDVLALSKLRASKCPQSQTTNDIDISCCQYDKNDCSIAYTGEYRDSYYNCTGKSSCNKRVSWMNTPSYCDTTIYMKETNYMMINYYCIPDTTSTYRHNTLDPCSNARISDREVFLYASRQSPFQCNCMIEPMCKMEYRINVLVISGSSQEENICEQIKVFSPKNSFVSNGCNTTNNYLPATLFNGFEDILSLKLTNDYVVPGGRFLIQIEGFSRTGQIKISCGKPAFSRMRTSAISQECDIDTTTSVTTPTKERFIKVKSCESTHNLHCKDPFCLPGWYLDSFFFICPDLGNTISQGYCPVYSLLGGRVTFRKESLCKKFNATCPDKPYEASDIKKYPTCTKIDTVNKCYIDDPKCSELRNTIDETDSTETSTKVQVSTAAKKVTSNGSTKLSTEDIWLYCTLYLLYILPEKFDVI